MGLLLVAGEMRLYAAHALAAMRDGWKVMLAVMGLSY
jgi:hypothetical protein